MALGAHACAGEVPPAHGRHRFDAPEQGPERLLFGFD
jgi:hypothetical protein